MTPTILVVGDDDALLRSIRRALERARYAVIEARDVAEARAAVARQVPDLVIMDLVLPGMEGREGANVLLARNPDLPVLFVSGFTSQESVRMGRLSGGSSFLRKPFTVAELLEAVERMLPGEGTT